MGSFTLEQWDRHLPQLGEQFKTAIIRGLRSAALRAKVNVVSAIDDAFPYPAVDTGGLRNSVDVVDTPTGAEVFVDAPHAAPIEHGTRPFTPPLGPLIVWVHRKGLVSKLGSGEMDQEEYEFEVRRVALAIQAKIAREGIMPRHYFAKGMAASQNQTLAEVKREISKVKG